MGRAKNDTSYNNTVRKKIHHTTYIVSSGYTQQKGIIK